MALASVLAWSAVELERAPELRSDVAMNTTIAAMLAGLAYLLGLAPAASALRGKTLASILFAALLARAILAVAPPILETDFRRYLWDGAVVASGLNPYLHAPEAAMLGTVDGEQRHELHSLAADSGDVLAGVNHPHLRTIYPPLAQAAFAAAAWIAPFEPNGLRAVFALADLATALLLWRTLVALGRPPGWIALYALNPLLLRETYLGLHMDVLVLPFVAGALLAAARARRVEACVWCVAGAAVKVWPIVLLPTLLLRRGAPAKRVALQTLGLALLGAALWWPVFSGGLDEASGFRAYARSWENNDGFFRAGIWLVERSLELVQLPAYAAHPIMRVVSVVGVLGVIVVATVSSSPNERDPSRALGAICAAVFLLSPTQFPWYWMWCLPFLVLYPRRPLELYVVLLPLYYVSDQLEHVHWLQHAPVWALLGVEFWRRRSARGVAGASSQVPHV